jgi:hypothetical protein
MLAARNGAEPEVNLTCDRLSCQALHLKDAVAVKKSDRLIGRSETSYRRNQ